MTALLLKELQPHCLAGHAWHFHSSPIMDVDPAVADEFDQTFEPLEKKNGNQAKKLFTSSVDHLWHSNWSVIRLNS